MKNDNKISLKTVCTYYKVQPDFIYSLSDFGLIEIIKNEEDECIDEECLPEIETMMHLHYDLEINLEGIDAIHHLLNRLRETQKELNRLRNRLS